MARFTYRARTQEGKITRGILRAQSEERASALLRNHGLTPVEITASENQGLLNREILSRPISTKDRILFSRQLSSMIEAGVPIVEALKSLLRQTKRPSAQRLLEEMIYDIEGGESLSGAMSRHPKAFSPFFLGVVRTGEASGRLSTSLSSLADHIEQDYIFVRKVRAALIYPIFILSVVVILAIIMIAFVLPQLTALFTEAGVTLPWPTRALIAVTTFFRRYWLVLLLIVGALGLLLRSYLRTPEGRYTASSYLLRLPVLSPLFQKIYLARLTSVLHTLFESDVPVLESFALARESVGNRVYQRILDDTIQAIKDGSSISSVWQYEAFMPPLLTSMVGVAERTGQVGKAFAQAHVFFKRDVESILDSIAVLIEPILIIILGLGVGVVVAAVLLPIYNLVLVL